jgi:hypothetical protein
MPQHQPGWRTGTVRRLVNQTPSARTIRLDVAGWPGHLAGQHVDVRLTAADGCRTERSYSIGSAPGRGRRHGAGPTSFVGRAIEAVAAAGHDRGLVRAEDFGTL